MPQTMQMTAAPLSDEIWMTAIENQKRKEIEEIFQLESFRTLLISPK